MENYWLLKSKLIKIGKYIILFSLINIHTSFAIEITCNLKGMPTNCLSLKLKQGDTVFYKVKAFTRAGKPAFIWSLTDDSKRTSTAEFQKIVSKLDGQQGYIHEIFYADDGDGIGKDPGIESDDDTFVKIPVEKNSFKPDETPANFEDVKVVYKGKEYSANEAKKLLLKQGDTVFYKVKAFAKAGKPAFIWSLTDDSKRTSTAEFQKIVSKLDGQEGYIHEIFYADDGDGIGIDPGIESDDDTFVKIPVEKNSVNLSNNAVKFASIEINAVPAKSTNKDSVNLAKEIYDRLVRFAKPKTEIPNDKSVISPVKTK